MFTPTCEMVRQLLNAKKALKLEALLKKLDRYAVVWLDDIGFVQQDREEMKSYSRTWQSATIGAA